MKARNGKTGENLKKKKREGGVVGKEGRKKED